MSKHTPGPWLNGQDGFNLGSGVVYGRHSNGNPKDVATIRGWGGEQQANSRLIAAAPDLLYALEECISELEKYQNTSHPEGYIGARDYLVKIANSRAVIAKAKGEQS